MRIKRTLCFSPVKYRRQVIWSPKQGRNRMGRHIKVKARSGPFMGFEFKLTHNGDAKSMIVRIRDQVGYYDSSGTWHLVKDCENNAQIREGQT